MNSCSSLTFAITAIANWMAGNLSDDELSLAGAVFTQLGDTLTTISVQRTICNKDDISNKKPSKT